MSVSNIYDAKKDFVTDVFIFAPQKIFFVFQISLRKKNT